MDFYQKVAAVCRMIPRGKVATYGQIAYLCGLPRNARQVGYALNRQISGQDVPAHRVVNGQGRLSGAAAFETPQTQRLRLEAEGIPVEEGKRVNLKKFCWRPDEAELHRLQELEPPEKNC